MAVGAAVAAASAGSLGVGLSGGGFLLPFILGAINMLYVELQAVPYTAPVAGASTGAIASTCVAGAYSVLSVSAGGLPTPNTTNQPTTPMRLPPPCFGRALRC
jgi:hypothetical protein